MSPPGRDPAGEVILARPAAATARLTWMVARPSRRRVRRMAARAPVTLPAAAGVSMGPAPRALYPRPYWA